MQIVDQQREFRRGVQVRAGKRRGLRPQEHQSRQQQLQVRRRRPEGSVHGQADVRFESGTQVLRHFRLRRHPLQKQPTIRHGVVQNWQRERNIGGIDQREKPVALAQADAQLQHLPHGHQT